SPPMALVRPYRARRGWQVARLSARPAPAMLAAMASDPIRCTWRGMNGDPLYEAYHDKEWGVPERDARALWEKLVLDGFQAGLAWITILRKRDAFRAAFAGFDPEKVARFGEADRARLMADAGIIRSNAKIDAAVASARTYLDMREAGVDFADFCW